MIHPPSAAGWRQSTAPPSLVPPLQPPPPMQAEEGGGLPFVGWRRIEEKKGLLLAYLQVIYLSLFPGCQEEETCRRDKKDRDKRERENGRNRKCTEMCTVYTALYVCGEYVWFALCPAPFDSFFAKATRAPTKMEFTVEKIH